MLAPQKRRAPDPVCCPKCACPAVDGDRLVRMTGCCGGAACYECFDARARAGGVCVLCAAPLGDVRFDTSAAPPLHHTEFRLRETFALAELTHNAWRTLPPALRVSSRTMFADIAGVYLQDALRFGPACRARHADGLAADGFAQMREAGHTVLRDLLYDVCGPVRAALRVETKS